MGVKMSLELPWPNDERLQQLCENLLNNQGYLPTLDNLADKINVSSRTLMRLFVKETGLTFRHWVQQMHVISAVTLLDDGYSLPIVWAMPQLNRSAICLSVERATHPVNLLVD